jgi:Ser/Thr protein kinase RdoA (MazF antagonist)
MSGGPPAPDDPALRVARRRGVPELGAHLERTYGIAVAGVDQLDLGVYRVDRADGPAWVARVFPAGRPRERVDGDAAILRLLARRDYPAERVAADQPVSALEGQPLLVSEHVAGVPRGERRAAIVAAGGLRALGAMLAAAQAMSIAPEDEVVAARPGGAWHHLADGGPRAELDALARLLEDRPRPSAPRGAADAESLRLAVRGLDDGAGLPEAFTHPDFVMANVVATADGRMVMVDWAGAGRAPRMWSLAFLLWAVGFGGDLARVDRIVAGYRRRIAPEPEELARLETLVAVRPIVFEAWGYGTGRRPLREAVAGVAAVRERAAGIAARAVAAFGAAGD